MMLQMLWILLPLAVVQFLPESYEMRDQMLAVWLGVFHAEGCLEKIHSFQPSKTPHLPSLLIFWIKNRNRLKRAKAQGKHDQISESSSLLPTGWAYEFIIDVLKITQLIIFISTHANSSLSFTPSLNQSIALWYAPQAKPVGIFCFEGIVRILDQYLDIVEPHLDRIMERMDRIEPHLPYILLHLAPWDTGLGRLCGWAGNPVDFFWGTQKEWPLWNWQIRNGGFGSWMFFPPFFWWGFGVRKSGFTMHLRRYWTKVMSKWFLQGKIGMMYC